MYDLQFLTVPSTTPDLSTHLEDLAYKFPAEPIERAVVRFCEAIANWRGLPELENVRSPFIILATVGIDRIIVQEKSWPPGAVEDECCTAAFYRLSGAISYGNVTERCFLASPAESSDREILRSASTPTPTWHEEATLEHHYVWEGGRAASEEDALRD